VKKKLQKTRPKTIQEEYIICDFCGDEMKVGERCSHCGKDICEKHFSYIYGNQECLIGEGEDTWILCPECSKKAKVIHSGEPVSDIESEYEYTYPVFKDTGKEMSLEYW